MCCFFKKAQSTVSCPIGQEHNRIQSGIHQGIETFFSNRFGIRHVRVATCDQYLLPVPETVVTTGSNSNQLNYVIRVTCRLISPARPRPKCISLCTKPTGTHYTTVEDFVCFF